MPGPSILVAHPNRQHSHQLALALHKNDLLEEYWTGVPSKPASKNSPIGRLMVWLSDNDLLPIPAHKIRHCFIEPIVNNLARRSLPPPIGVYWGHCASAWFDMWCASRLGTVQADMVVAYENAALRTFESAKRRGLITVLDAASLHHRWQDQFYDYVESERVHQSITQRKDEEIELADHILTVSDFARRSYVDAGLDPQSVTTVPMGCDLDRFSVSEKDDRVDRVFEFVCVGQVGKLKGIDLLLNASGQIVDDYPHHITVIGGQENRVDWTNYPWVTSTGRIPQSEVANYLDAADCFVLPSRFDSFGRVVIEAMASGLPVIVSDRVGAQEAVKDGESGWVITADDSDALKDAMLWCITNREKLSRMGNRAAEVAKKYSWPAYHSRATETLGTIFQRRAMG